MKEKENGEINEKERNQRKKEWMGIFLVDFVLFRLFRRFLLLICVIAFNEQRPAVEAQRQASERKPAAIELISPNGLALDREGNLLISDIGAHRVFKLDRRGKLTAVAGTGQGGFGGDGGPAIAAQLHAPHDLAFDGAGNLLIADTGNQRIRRIDRQGIMMTLAASLNNPQSIALDGAGNLLIAETYHHVIRRLDPRGVVTTIAGTVPGFGGDGGPAAKAQINLPMAVAVGPDRSIYISDAANSRIRRITPDGTIRTVVGYGPAQDTYGGGFAGDEGPAEKAKIFSATDLKLDAAGNLYICDSGNHRIRVIRQGIITTIAGNGKMGAGGDGGKAVAAELNTPQKIAIAADGSLYISDRANGRVRKVDSKGVVSTIAGRK